MLVRRGFLALVAVLAAATATLPAGEKKSPEQFFIKDGDTVVMMGDSITEQHLYSNYVEMWTVSRFPAWKLTFRNVGIGGDRSTAGNNRFKRDVLAYKPTVLTVDFGMNDGNYDSFKPKAFETYMKGLQGIADQAKAADIRVAWITPQPVEHNPGDPKESYNDTLEKFSAGVKEIATKNGGLFVDQFHPYWAVIKKARDEDVKGRITGGDAVHPGPPGQALMAASILDGLGFPRLVSKAKVTITKEASPTAVKGENCTITNFKVNDDPKTYSVHFQRLDKALPYFPEEAKGILKYTPLREALNDYSLQVTGLPPGPYEIRLGGKKVAEHSAVELAKGVNLAAAVLQTGPIADQVKKVWKAVQDKNRYFHDKVFRGVVLAKIKDETERKDMYESAMKKMPELDAAVREALAMQPYTVDIVPAAKGTDKKDS